MRKPQLRANLLRRESRGSEGVRVTRDGGTNQFWPGLGEQLVHVVGTTPLQVHRAATSVKPCFREMGKGQGPETSRIEKRADLGG